MLLDFNPFGPVTDSLLFTWDELEGESLYTAHAGDSSSSPQVNGDFVFSLWYKVLQFYSKKDRTFWELLMGNKKFILLIIFAKFLISSN